MSCLLCLTTYALAQAPDRYEVRSPDQTIGMTVELGSEIRYSVDVDGQIVVKPSPISLTLQDDRTLGRNPVVTAFSRDSIRREVRPVLPEKFEVIDERFHQLSLAFEDDYAVDFRAYDNGVAYRFRTDFGGQIEVQYERITLQFEGASHVYFPEEESFFSHNERTYVYEQIDTMSVGRLASLPVLIATEHAKVLVAESGLRDYPGLWLQTAQGGRLNGVFPHYALESEPLPESDRNVPVTEYADFIAKTGGARSYPWRILAIARDDGDLLTNQLVYLLGGDPEIVDVDWIKPGKVAWDWWNANNIHGVDFKSGVNTATYKYFIDFASEFGIDYVILDEGWYELGDLFSVVPEMDVEELIAYGRDKDVGIILWVIWKTLDDQLPEALDRFAEWGAAGIKVDFMQRDDQEMVNYYWKIADEAARRRLLVDYHGAYKPAGLRRTYPNVITREGLKGLEWNKWSEDITPTHNLTIPFVRMVAGPIDYTPGATINAQPDNFRVVFSRPMSMGTRAHQVAMYVVYESPLQMMADSPSNYLKEPETTRFIAGIPTTWHDTRVLEASVGEYVALARRHGGRWLLGAMTNEDARALSVDLSFLDDGEWEAEIFRDGANADRTATDHKIETKTVSAGGTIEIDMAPGGGWVAILSREDQSD